MKRVAAAAVNMAVVGRSNSTGVARFRLAVRIFFLIRERVSIIATCGRVRRSVSNHSHTRIGSGSGSGPVPSSPTPELQ